MMSLFSIRCNASCIISYIDVHLHRTKKCVYILVTRVESMDEHQGKEYLACLCRPKQEKLGLKLDPTSYGCNRRKVAVLPISTARN